MKTFYHLLKVNRVKVSLTIIVQIMASLIMVYASYSLSYLLKGFGGSESYGISNLMYDTGLVLGIWIIAILFSMSSDILKQKTIQYLKNDLRDVIASKITSIPFCIFKGKDSGHYVSWLTNDVDNITKLSFDTFFSLFEKLSSAIFSIIALFYISYFIGITTIILFFFVSVLPQIAGKKLSKVAEERSFAQEESMESFKDSIMGFSILYLSNMLKEIKIRIKTSSVKVEKANFKFEKCNLYVLALVGAMNIIGQIILIATSILATILKMTPLGSVFAVGNLSGQFFTSVGEVSGSLASFRASKSLWEKFNLDGDSIEANKKINNIDNINIHELTFKYADKTILNINNLSFDAGKKYALIGESGSGKSTLVNLLLDLLPEYSGKVLVNGLSLSEINKRCLYNKIAYVEQKVYMFQDTIRFNITLGADYTDHQISEILKRVKLDDFIASLPDGLDTVINEDGKNISGGQKQRIAIARALIRNIDVLIMDEGTSALDKATALSIENELIDDKKLCLILITHNLQDMIKDRLDTVYDMATINNK